MRESNKKQFIVLGVIIWLLIAGGYFAVKYQIFGLQHTSQSSEKTSLEKDR